MKSFWPTIRDAYRLATGAPRSESISRYTVDNWGRQQLLEYVGGLLDRLVEIASNPKLGRNMFKIPTHFFRVQFRSHFIFYRVAANDARIVRILRQSMDAVRHLN